VHEAKLYGLIKVINGRGSAVNRMLDGITYPASAFFSLKKKN